MTDAAELVKLADDLPARLRGLVEYGQSVALSDALEQAADEIERLRAAIAAQQDGATERQKDALFNLARAGGYRLNDVELTEAVRCVNRARYEQ